MMDDATPKMPTLDCYLPGDPPPEEQVERMIRVNQAGEFGATRIYAGQLSVLGKSRLGDTIRHMQDQEIEHHRRFNRLLVERRVRPTLLTPFWHVAGYALGAATAMLGEKAALACTVAVEEVIDEHYQAQSIALGEHEPELKATIEQFRAEENEHRETALDHGAELAPAYPVLTTAIKLSSKLAIFLSTRF